MESNEEIALGVIRTIEQRDVEGLLELCADDVELHDAPSLPYGGTTRGKAALIDQSERQPARTWLGTWDPLQPTEEERRMDAEVVATAGDTVTIRYMQRALSPTGERYESPVVAVYEFRDGRFARAQMFHYDTAGILSFLERAWAAA